MIDVLKSALTRFGEDRCSTLAASLAYYTIFSLPPLLFILVTTLTVSISWYYGSEQAEEKAFELIQGQVGKMIGNPAAENQIGQIMKSDVTRGGLGWKTLLSLAGVIFGATGVVASLQDSLNRVWGIKPDPVRSSWRGFLFKRLLSLGMILGLGFVLLVSFILSTVLDSLTTAIGTTIGFNVELAAIVNYTLSFLFVTVIFAAIFKFMPDVEIQWKDVWVGAIGTAILFTLGRIFLQWYVSYSNPGEQLGSAVGSLVVVLVWVYYSSMIVLLGAEFTQAWLCHLGRELKPERGAVRFVEKTVSA